MIEVNSIKMMLLTVAVTIPRMIAAFSVVPFLGQQMLPGLIRNGVLLSLMLILYPMIRPTLPPEIHFNFLFFGVIIKESIIGLLIGFMASILFWVSDSVGYAIDNQRGTTMASVMDPMTGQQTSPLGSMLTQFITVIFFSSGGFLVFLTGIFESYRVWPIFSFYPRMESGFALFFLQQTDRLMELTLVLAAPVLIAVFISEFGLGLINRFAPQLNVFFLSMPIKSAVAGFMLIIYLSYLVTYFKKEFVFYDNIIDILKIVIK